MTHKTTSASLVELDPACTPAHIETRSFEIIDAEIPEPRPFAGSLWNVARRCIHTLGDTDIVHDLRLSSQGLKAGVAALLQAIEDNPKIRRLDRQRILINAITQQDEVAA